MGTAGHIDHGKTTLIKALTGINTDRLKEEQRRGITIELGFAYYDLPSGQHVGIVDVPGHEKFVKNMVAGATGIDIVAMVIAADEGVMLQTREHMEICMLLGIRHGFVVLTKTDLVDEELLELVLEDVREFVQGTFLEDQPVVPVSAQTGEGMPGFIETLDRISRSVPERASTGLFRLPVDRVFTIKGFGTVITGTLISGQVEVGETVMLYPSGLTAKVRGIQVHNESVGRVQAGMRTAVNFQGLEKRSVNRGDVLSAPDALFPSYMLDISFQYLKSNKKPIKNRTRVRLHTGTSEILGNLILLEKDELPPGETTVAQLRLDTPVGLVKDDRYVVRSYSPVRTIGGGHVLNPVPGKHKRFQPAVVDGLKKLMELPPEPLVAYHAAESGYRGAAYAQLKVMTNLPEKLLQQALQGLLSRKEILQIDKEERLFIHQRAFEDLIRQVTDILSGYHQAHPLKPGMSKEELRSKLPPFLGAKLYNLILNQMLKTEDVVQEGKTIRLAAHRITLGTDQADVKQKILDAYADSGLTPPYFTELGKNLGFDSARTKDVLMILVEEGKILKVKEDLYFHANALNGLKADTVAFLKKEGEMSTPQFKAIAGVSRKYLIPLIEFFDSQNITIRIGDIRKLRSG